MNRKTCYLIGAFLLLYTMSHAQDLAVIYDKDGYTNVRKSTSVNSPIIGKIREGQVFSISPFNDEVESQDWFVVWFPIAPQTNVKDFIKSESTERSGFVHISRITLLNQLKQVKPQLVDSARIVFKNEEFEVSLETQSYQNPFGSKEKLGLNKDSPQWGSFGRLPKKKLKSIRLKTKSGVYQFPRNAIIGLYEINLDQTKVYVGKKKEIYIATSNADGSENYDAIWCLKNGKIFSMTVMQTIP